MDTLFDTSEFELEIERKTEVKVMAQKHKRLSKNQITFNRLIKNVERLQKEILTETEKLDKLLLLYNEKLPTLEKGVAECQIKIAKKIASTTKTIKYGKRQLENIGVVIVELLDNAFEVVEPDEEAEKLYDAYAEESYQEEKNFQIDQMREAMEEMLRQKMGIDVDFSDLDDSPESFARLQQKIQEELSNKKAEEPKKEKKKTKKQLEKELQQAQEEAMKLKSVRSIYISLAKVLHPDTESDPADKLLKEELMKKLTVAYQEKDLPTLLKLEMEWVAAEYHDVDKLSDEKLKLYISSLKDQVNELEDEKYTILRHPRYQAISDLVMYSEPTAIRELNNRVSQTKVQKQALEELLADFSVANPKKEIMDFVNESIEMLDFDPFDFFDNHFR
jgi:hypothetical protein